MWSDNETNIDYLNFTGVANTVAEIIVQSKGQPVSIGISGKWGVGKSSLVRLVENSLVEKSVADADNYLFISFNAWLYQGYDDARAALMEVIANALLERARRDQTACDKATELLARVKWLRVAKSVVTTGVALAAGVPPPGFVAEAAKIIRAVHDGSANASTVEDAGKLVGDGTGAFSDYLDSTDDVSIPQEIQALRDEFEETLSSLGVTLVVLIDDLDRCLPETTISTLEAIRLFLFLKNTAFVIAADNDVIKVAVSKHFGGYDDDLVTNYFDKLIQVPIRVPKLGMQEVRAYLILLYVENSSMKDGEKAGIREAVCKQLAGSWQGKRVDRAFIDSLGYQLADSVVRGIDIAERIAPLLTRDLSRDGGGNPRLIKRFLNEISIRQAIAKSQSISVDEEVLMKMLLFERCANSNLFEELVNDVGISETGRMGRLTAWEADAHDDKFDLLKDEWDIPFVRSWLNLEPPLANKDLRAVLYLSREHIPAVGRDDQLSSDGADVLEALLKNPDFADKLEGELATLTSIERVTIFSRLLQDAKLVETWGKESLLHALSVVSKSEPSQAQRLVLFLKDLPPTSIKAGIVPLIAGSAWSADVFAFWANSPDIGKPVKAAIENIGA